MHLKNLIYSWSLFISFQFLFAQERSPNNHTSRYHSGCSKHPEHDNRADDEHVADTTEHDETDNTSDQLTEPAQSPVLIQQTNVSEAPGTV